MEPSLREIISSLTSVAHEQSMLEPCSSRACSIDLTIRSLLGESTLKDNRVIPREISRDMVEGGCEIEPHSLVWRPN